MAEDVKLSSADKKRFIASVVGSFKAKPEDNPLAVFAAGIPGAGKTEFLERLFENEPDYVRIDLDEIVKLIPGYSAQEYYRFRGAANIIVDEVFRYCRKNKLNFVLDGTFGHSHAVENIEKSLGQHSVVIFYIWKDPVSSWQLTKDREAVTNRAINRAGFMDAYVNIPNNLRKVRSKFGDAVKIIAIKKTSAGHGFEMLRQNHEIDQLLSRSYTKEELEKIIP